jgi:hypothetical protein
MVDELAVLDLEAHTDTHTHTHTHAYANTHTRKTHTIHTCIYAHARHAQIIHEDKKACRPEHGADRLIGEELRGTHTHTHTHTHTQDKHTNTQTNARHAQSIHENEKA